MKNPSVFPNEETVWEGDESRIVEHPGMSLLDHFAGLAMQATLSSSTRMEGIGIIHEKTKEDIQNIVAALSYEHARAMLEERAKPENQL